MKTRSKRILKRLDLNKNWTEIKLKKYNDFYLIGLKKEKVAKKDTLDKDCAKKIRFEVAIDSGKKNKYLTIGYITLDFNRTSSSDDGLNLTSALTKVVNQPSRFFIRPIDITGESEVVTCGRCSIEVYLAELKLV